MYTKPERERERARERETDRQRETETDGERERQRQRERQTERETDRRTDGERERWGGGEEAGITQENKIETSLLCPMNATNMTLKYKGQQGTMFYSRKKTPNKQKPVANLQLSTQHSCINKHYKLKKRELLQDFLLQTYLLSFTNHYWHKTAIFSHICLNGYFWC